MNPGRLLGLAVAVLLGAALYFAWIGVEFGPVRWDGVWAVLGDTWLWDLRYPLIPAYVVGVLGLAEKIGAGFTRGH